MSVRVVVEEIAPTGKSLWTRFYNADGSTNSEAATPETPAGSSVYRRVATLTMIDNVNAATPYAEETREATDATTFNASLLIWGPKTEFWVKNQARVSEPIFGNLDVAVSSVSGGGGGGSGDTITSEGESVTSTDAVT